MVEAQDGLVLVGRSSSHFTRVVRIFAVELGVVHGFRAVFEIGSQERATFAGNPALKMPILLDERGPLFGTENICRELVLRAGSAGERVVLRGSVDGRMVANCEELVLHAMSSEVALIMGQAAGEGHRPPPKVSTSLDNTLHYLNEHCTSLLAALPRQRTLSFVEVALFSVLTHLTFRKVRDIEQWPRLAEFCRAFAATDGARATEYHFDVA